MVYFWTPNFKDDVDKLGRIQRREGEMLKHFEKKTAIRKLSEEAEN